MRRLHLFAVLVALASVIALGGCGTDKKGDDTAVSTKSAPVTTTTESDQWISEPLTEVVFEVKNEDIFETGYYKIQLDTSNIFSDSLSFTRYKNYDIDWKVYVLDEELEDGFDLLENMTPAVVNEGEVKISDGQWIYIWCSCNSSNNNEPTDGFY